MKYLRRKRETKYRKSRKNRRNRKNKTRKIKGGFSLGFLPLSFLLAKGLLNKVPDGLTNNSLIAVTDSSGRRPPNLPPDKLLVIKDPQNQPNEIQELDAHASLGTRPIDSINLREGSNTADLLEQQKNMQYVQFNYLFNQNQKPGKVNFFEKIKSPDYVKRHIDNLYPN